MLYIYFYLQLYPIFSSIILISKKVKKKIKIHKYKNKKKEIKIEYIIFQINIEYFTFSEF